MSAKFPRWGGYDHLADSLLAGVGNGYVAFEMLMNILNKTESVFLISCVIPLLQNDLTDIRLMSSDCYIILVLFDHPADNV